MEGSIVTLQEIYAFKQTGVDSTGKVLGDLHPTGLRPRFADKFDAFGIHLGDDVFGGGRWG
jgi:pilus assembly protein CpaF